MATCLIRTSPESQDDGLASEESAHIEISLGLLGSSFLRTVALADYVGSRSGLLAVRPVVQCQSTPTISTLHNIFQLFEVWCKHVRVSGLTPKDGLAVLCHAGAQEEDGPNTPSTI